VRRRTSALIPAGALIVALLVWLCWPSGDDGPTVQQATTGEHQVQLTVDDPRLGLNSLAVDIAPSTVDRVTVEPVMPQMGHALAPVTATAAGPGRYQAEITLPMTGQWEITVRLGEAGEVVFPLLVKG
jgi:YtkA-like